MNQPKAEIIHGEMIAGLDYLGSTDEAHRFVGHVMFGTRIIVPESARLTWVKLRTVSGAIFLIPLDDGTQYWAEVLPDSEDELRTTAQGFAMLFNLRALDICASDLAERLDFEHSKQTAKQHALLLEYVNSPSGYMASLEGDVRDSFAKVIKLYGDPNRFGKLWPFEHVGFEE